MDRNTRRNRRLVVVGGEMAKGVATRLAERWEVRLLSDDGAVVDGTSQIEAVTVEFEATDLRRHAGDADVAVVVTDRDRTGLLVTQLLAATCSVDEVVTRVDDAENSPAFEGIDCELIETSPLVRSEVERRLATEGG